MELEVPSRKTPSPRGIRVALLRSPNHVRLLVREGFVLACG